MRWKGPLFPSRASVPCSSAPAVKFIFQGVFFVLNWGLMDNPESEFPLPLPNQRPSGAARPAHSSPGFRACGFGLAVCGPERLAQSWGSRYLSVPHGRSADDTLSSPRINEDSGDVTPSRSRCEVEAGSALRDQLATSGR